MIISLIWFIKKKEAFIFNNKLLTIFLLNIYKEEEKGIE